MLTSRRGFFLTLAALPVAAIAAVKAAPAVHFVYPRHLGVMSSVPNDWLFENGSTFMFVGHKGTRDAYQALLSVDRRYR